MGNNTYRIALFVYALCAAACTVKIETGEPQITVQCVEFVAGSNAVVRCQDAGMADADDAAEEPIEAVAIVATSAGYTPWQENYGAQNPDTTPKAR